MSWIIKHVESFQNTNLGLNRLHGDHVETVNLVLIEEADILIAPMGCDYSGFNCIVMQTKLPTSEFRRTHLDEWQTPQLTYFTTVNQIECSARKLQFVSTLAGNFGSP